MLDRPVPFATTTLGLAHDFRNLLQMATAAINIIERGTPGRSQRVHQAIVGARASLERAGELALRTLEQSPDVLEGSGFANVPQALHEVREIIANANGPGIAVTVDVDHGADAVACERLEFQGALLNLAFNALHAIGAEGSISIGARLAEDPSLIEVSVSDDGVGMNADTLARAFDLRFTTRAKRVGGFGLASVQSFVRTSGGTIAVESRPDAGTTVVMRLPRTSTGLGGEPIAL